MQNAIATLVTAICGAMIAVAAVIVMTNAGLMPVNEGAIRSYLLRNPQIVNEMAAAAQKQEEVRTAAANEAMLKKVGLNAFFDRKVAFVTGPENAPNTMVEFYDYDCPFCRASLPAVRKIVEQRKGDTRFAFIEMPIKELHGESAVNAAVASVAAARIAPDKFLAFHYYLMGQSEQITEEMIFAGAKQAGIDIGQLRAEMTKPATAAAVNGSYEFAKKVGIDGTPTFIINGKMYPGAMDEAAFQTAFGKK